MIWRVPSVQLLVSIGLLPAMGLAAFLVGASVAPVVSSDDYMMVGDIGVSDAEYGEDHVVSVDREILRTFTGVWTVEVNSNAEGTDPICAASGTNVYKPADTVPDQIQLHHWWMFDGRPVEMQCRTYPLPVGCYTATTVWHLRSKGKLIEDIIRISPEFCVTSPE